MILYDVVITDLITHEAVKKEIFHDPNVAAQFAFREATVAWIGGWEREIVLGCEEHTPELDRESLCIQITVTGEK